MLQKTPFRVDPLSMAEDTSYPSAAVADQPGLQGDGRWQASDGNWYPAQEHPDAAHRSAWSSYRPFGATIAPDQLPVIAVQPMAEDAMPGPSRRKKLLVVLSLGVITALVLIAARVLG